MTAVEQQARDSLFALVRHVFAHREGVITSITYQELALRIGRLNKHGEGHGHGIGWVLGTMGHMVQDLEGEWGERLPHIQSLVVQKTGTNKGLPDDGIKEFWPDYPLMTRTEKEFQVQREHKRIAEFGSRWNDILVKLGLPKVTMQQAPTGFGTSGESQKHKDLKAYIRQHPELVGATSDWHSFVEYPLPSLDAIDVLFRTHGACVAVEVKSSISDALPTDYERGLFQTIKYQALLQAMTIAGGYSIPSKIATVLVLESQLPIQYRQLAKTLGIMVIEDVYSKK